MEVDSFRYVSRLIKRYYQLTKIEAELPIPWTPLTRPLGQSRFGLVTSGGLYHQGQEPSFNVERERQEPTWGDPSFRSLPASLEADELGFSHLHINGSGVTNDINILLPVHRFAELEEEGRIGSQATVAYSFMGYQGFPADLTGWRDIYGPQVAQKLLAEGVDNVLLTTAWPECAANVPVLARIFEAAGMSTIMVTNMPFWAEKIGVPRTLAAEFPFGHTLGQPGNKDQQMRVIRRALEVLETAERPGTIVHFQEKWPASFEEGCHDSHPEVPPPIGAEMGRHIGSFLRGLRRGKRQARP